MPLRSYPEPQISASEAVAVAALGLTDFAIGDGVARLAAALVPAERSALTVARRDALALATALSAGRYTGALLLEVRGYILRGLGKPDANDVNVFDDALIYLEAIHGDVTRCVRVRGNVDPSRLVAGVASKVAPQLYHVREGRHRERRGLRQDSPVLIDRHGAGGVEYRVDPARWPYTNVHEDKGSGTGSAGCSTTPAGEWAILYGAAKGAGRIPTVLVEEKARQAWRAAGKLA